MNAERMRANLDAGGGQPMAESVMFALAEQMGRAEAKRVVGEAAQRAADGGLSLRDELVAGEAGDRLGEAELDRALDPSGYLGSARAFVDRALQIWASWGSS